LFHGGRDLYIRPRKGGKHALRIVREVLARGEGRAVGLFRAQGVFRAAKAGEAVVRESYRRRRRASRGRATSIAAAARVLSARCCRGRAVLFLVSDFFSTRANLQVACATRNRKHDVRRGADHRSARGRDAGRPGS